FQAPHHSRFRAPRRGQLALRLHAEEIRAGRGHPPRNSRHHARPTLMQDSLVARSWRARDRTGWRNFGVAMLVLSAALLVALFSATVAQQGRILLAAITTVISLGMAAWVAVTIVPALARRTSLRWLKYQVDYRLTRDGI